MAHQCQAITKAGARCKQASTVNETGLCLLHDPARKRQARAAQRRGARASQKKKMDGRIRTVDASEAPPAPESIADCVRWASWATHAVAVGAIDSRTAHEIGFLLNALQRAIRDTKVADDVAELRAQLAELRRGSVGVVR